MSDTSNLCGSLEFSEQISKSKTQPIIGSQIKFKFQDIIGSLPIIAKNSDGYKELINLSSKSFLEKSDIDEPHCNIETLIDSSKKHYVHCAGGYRSMIACSIMKRNGYNDLVDVAGGYSSISKHPKIEIEIGTDENFAQKVNS